MEKVETGSKSGFAYSDRTMRKSMPKYVMPDQSTSARVAKTLIQDDMSLDNKPLQNLASFVTTYMEEEVEQLMNIASQKNFIDLDQYPHTTDISNRCVNMIARMWNAPLKKYEQATGTACIGSTEAIMLGVLALKFRWREARKAAGKSTDKPNIVFGSNTHISWKKAARYFDLEARLVNMSPDSLIITPERVKPLIDENTIGVGVILGTTYTGQYEDVKGIHDMVQKLNEENGWHAYMHVDAASGGFIAPFLTPELVWDFRLPLVKSINASGHKFGLVYAGIGWLVLREKRDLPEDLTFSVNYLGGDQSHFTLNFTRSAANIVGQYYNFLRLGREGFTEVLVNCMQNANFLRKALQDTGRVVIRDTGEIPLVAFSLKDDDKLPYSVFEVQDKLRGCGWIVPAYTGPPGAEELKIMRIVVKENFSHDLAEWLVTDFMHALEYLDKDHHEQKEMLHKALEHQAEKQQPPTKEAPARDEQEEEGEEERLEGLPKHLHAHLHGRSRRTRHLRHPGLHRLSGRSTHGVC